MTDQISAWTHIFERIVVILTVAVVLIVLYTTKKNEDAINAEQCYAEFENAAVISDDERCNIIGKVILEKGGSLVDGIIAVTLCIGVVNPQSSGIGGGFFMTYIASDYLHLFKLFENVQISPNFRQPDTHFRTHCIWTKRLECTR